MRTRIHCTFIIAALMVTALYTGTAHAQLTSVTRERAVAVANNWLHFGQEMNWGWQSVPDFSMRSLADVSYKGELVGFALNVPSGGYVLIPSYEELPAITAYSTESSLDATSEEGPNLLLKEELFAKIGLARSVSQLKVVPPEWKLAGDQVRQDRAEWMSYSGSYDQFVHAVEAENQRLNPGHHSGRYDLDDINPLLATSWHQGAPYDNLCPIGDGGRCVVGCAATAMAQILAYYRSPVNGTGSHSYHWNGDTSCGHTTTGGTLSVTYSDTYDWGNILNSYGSGYTQAQADAVAELCYEVGVSLDMDYGYCGSGAYHPAPEINALRNYFGMADGMDVQYRNNYSSAASWFAMLQQDLNAQHPCYYGIYEHAIVLDGWRVAGTSQLHLNYGWADSHTAWYTVDNLYYSVPYFEEVIRYIHPSGPTLTVMSPNGGDIWYTGDAVTIQWTSNSLSENVKIELNRNYPSGAWVTTAANTENDGTYPWTVSGAATSAARIRISGVTHTNISDVSNANFAIHQRSITVTAPNGGDDWYIGDAATIRWTSNSLSEHIKIELNRNYPSGSWETIVANTSNDGSYLWTASGSATSAARIRVSGVTHTSISDVSNANFAIHRRTITMSTPNGGEHWIVGHTYRINWTWHNLSERVRIQIKRSYPSDSWVDIQTNVTNDGSYPWPVTGPASNNCRIRVIGMTHPSVGDTSNANFRITSSEPGAIPEGPGGQQVEGGSAVSNLPGRLSLSQNYPNPFNPTTQISFALPEATSVRLEVFNTLGQSVATLVNDHLAAGQHLFTFDASALPSGVYLCRLTAGNQVEMKKMMLLK